MTIFAINMPKALISTYKRIRKCYMPFEWIVFEIFVERCNGALSVHLV